MQPQYTCSVCKKESYTYFMWIISFVTTSLKVWVISVSSS